jgi:hypothetical protein
MDCGLRKIIYRLHASRFKTLLRYVQESPGRCSHAEIEAHRISQENWYDDTTKSIDWSIQEDARGRIWKVYSDVVTALAQCRKENPYFHRSVFRHCQALLWPPIFLEDVDEGSLTHNNEATSRILSVLLSCAVESCLYTALSTDHERMLWTYAETIIKKMARKWNGYAYTVQIKE